MRRIEEFITSQRKNDALAVIDSDGNELSYKKLYKASLSLANVINNKAEKNILIQADNNAFFVIGLFAIWMSDKTAVLVNPVSRPEEICQLAEFCESETVIVGQSNRKLDNIDCIQVREFIYGATNFILNINNNCNSDALIIPTTGTTEYPKHVVLTHENVLAAEVAIAHGWGTDIANRELCVLPMHTVSGCVGQLLYMLSIQASILILSGGLSIIKLKQLTQHYKTNILIITPTLLAMLMNKKEGRTMLAGFRNITLCGEKVNIKKVSEWKRMLPDTVISETYGCTESSSAVVGSWKNDIGKPDGAVGRPLKNIKIKIGDLGKNDENGVNFQGEILIQGAQIFKGYYKNEADTQKVIKNGWLHTGDIGYMDSNDNLYITGRLKNIVIVSGQNIHIEEVEEVLKGFTFVDNAVVYGEPNELTGERLCAKVILRKNTIISQSEMKNYLRNELPEYKVPKKIEFVRRLDINIGGKINRKNEKKSCQDKEEHN